MHPALYLFVDGTPFLVGGLLMLTAVGVRAWSSRIPARIGSLVLALTGAGCVAVSSTPTPLWLIAAGGAIYLAWLLLDGWLTERRTPRNALRVAAALVPIAALAVELPHVLPPTPPAGPHDRLLVIGDSITTGIGGAHERPWPRLIRDGHGVEVVTSAQAGATVRVALDKLAAGLGDADGLVLLEIGGNDMLTAVPPADFERNLERLIQALASPGRRIVMLEIPSLPFRPGYTRAQRKLARRHNVVLIPKRHFARVLAHSDATLDGGHLSQLGHERMAAMVWRWVGPGLRPGTEAASGPISSTSSREAGAAP
jgi:lysophospholipase L1-like esterase